MSAFVRPPISASVFRDADGLVIEYGTRWRDQSPPEDTYSVVSHPQRFAPLHDIAQALIAHLASTFDVRVEDDPTVSADLIRQPEGVVRAVRVTPSRASCAPLTVVLTQHPGVYLHAGVLHDFHYPDCGCDACDESWEPLAEQLEKQVLAVTNGNYRESIRGGRWIEYCFDYPDGSASGRYEATEIPEPRFGEAAATLGDLLNGWEAWPARS